MTRYTPVSVPSKSDGRLDIILQEHADGWMEMQEMKKHPRKRMYRARAHSNPLNDANFDVPAHPDEYDW